LGVERQVRLGGKPELAVEVIETVAVERLVRLLDLAADAIRRVFDALAGYQFGHAVAVQVAEEDRPLGSGPAGLPAVRLAPTLTSPEPMPPLNPSRSAISISGRRRRPPALRITQTRSQPCSGSWNTRPGRPSPSTSATSGRGYSWRSSPLEVSSSPGTGKRAAGFALNPAGVPR